MHSDAKELWGQVLERGGIQDPCLGEACPRLIGAQRLPGPGADHAIDRAGIPPSAFKLSWARLTWSGVSAGVWAAGDASRPRD